MDTVTVLLLSVVIVLLVVLLLVVWRGAAGGGASLLQPQLVELRARLDALVGAQGEVPRALAEGSADQARSLAEVRERLIQLAEATSRLEAVGRSVAEVQDLLKVPKLRGTLGELWLEELLRQVFPEGLYETQFGFAGGERVDAVIRVGDRLVPVDAKFPLEACQRALVATGEAAERERRAFRRSLRERVDEIADKYIRPEEGTFDFALMYIPAENVYYEAVVRGGGPPDGDSFVTYALDRRVIPVSPNTFYAYLTAILHGLRGLEVEQRAQEILAALGGLQQQVTRFERAFELVGRHLEHATKQYDESGRQLTRVQDQLGGLTDVSGAAPDKIPR